MNTEENKNIKKVVLAYSGGLDTSVILKWLVEEYGCEVITFSADIGQFDCASVSELENSAAKHGAKKTYSYDLREEFVSDFVFPMFRANALYEGQYLLGTAIARPLIAKKQMEIATYEGADAVAHGAAGKGNEQLRFEVVYLAINPKIKIIVPWQRGNFNSRTALMNFAQKHSIKIPVTNDNPYSIDSNIVHTSYEGGLLEDPWQPPNENMFLMTNSLRDAPDNHEEIYIAFEKGDPISINREKMSPADIFITLNSVGGGHGIGRVDMVENRSIGIKSRGVYETPGGTILRKAHIALESIILSKEELELRNSLIPKYSSLVYEGLWFSPERYALQTLINKIQEKVSGTVKLELYKGNCVVLGRKSKNSTYKSMYETFEKSDVFNQKMSEDFIRMSSLRLQLNSN